MGEIRTVAHLVKNYYRHKNFCIITPYDAQRAAIEKVLKDENLPWDRVFNVDSFQGNEADYVLVSVVRSNKPGFLSSINRMNVMLTRCRVGLVVVTSKSFISFGGGMHTLLGDLARHWQQHYEGQSIVWVDWKLVADGTANLPGSLAPKPRAQQYKTPPTGYSNSSLESRVPLSHQGPTGGFDVSSLFRGRPPPSNHSDLVETPIKSTYAAVAQISSPLDWSYPSLWSTAASFPPVVQVQPQYYYPVQQPAVDILPQYYYPAQQPAPGFSSVAFPRLPIVPNYQGALRNSGQSDQNRFSLLRPKAPQPGRKSKPLSATQSSAGAQKFTPRSDFQPKTPGVDPPEDGWTRVDRRRGLGRRQVTYALQMRLPYSR